MADVFVCLDLVTDRSCDLHLVVAQIVFHATEAPSDRNWDKAWKWIGCKHCYQSRIVCQGRANNSGFLHRSVSGWSEKVHQFFSIDIVQNSSHLHMLWILWLWMMPCCIQDLEIIFEVCFVMLVFPRFRACYYCDQCHSDIVDIKTIKKCRCKSCKYVSGCHSVLVRLALSLMTFHF